MSPEPGFGFSKTSKIRLKMNKLLKINSGIVIIAMLSMFIVTHYLDKRLA